MSAAAEEIDFELTLDRPQASLDFQLVPGSINTNICSTTEEGEITSIEDVNDDGDSVFEQSRAKRQRVGAPFNLVPRAKQRPRIVKSDFRRNYVLMWANLFNAGDPDLLSRHIETYYHPDLVFSQTVLHCESRPYDRSNILPNIMYSPTHAFSIPFRNPSQFFT
ncbi:hypothetical protein B484DRAFT_459196 [Ochromonadaceae sp. CCMP2298]|nr:hypothetical protein B484DRAFT_459196 [Ochromonadaceae sp. CCMP2298]